MSDGAPPTLGNYLIILFVLHAIGQSLMVMTYLYSVW